MLWAQVSIPIGTWRTHFSYQQVNHVLATQKRIYGAAQNGLFYLDKTDQSLHVLSTTNGLSDVGITAMAHQPSSDALLLTYESGIIDLLSHNRITSFTLIRDANEREQIYHIHFYGNEAYLATSKGVRVLTITDELHIEIKESYVNLSKTGDNLTVYSSTTTNDSIFLATEEGIIAASLSPQANRQDYRNWRRFNLADGISQQPIHFITVIDHQIFAALDGDGLFVYNGTTWQATDIVTDQKFEALRANKEGLVMILGDSVILYEREHITVVKEHIVGQPQDAIVDDEGILWVGDSKNGLVRKQDDTFLSIFPEGPASDSIGSLHYVNNGVIALKNNTFTGKGAFYIFEEGNWTNYTTDNGLPNTAPVLDVVYDATESNYYFATFGSGILQWNGATGFNYITSSSVGSTLNNDQVTSLAIDRDRTLWVTNFDAFSPLHQFDLSEEVWQSFAFNHSHSRFPVDIELAEDGNLWILLHEALDLGNTGRDILLFNQETEDYLFIKEKLSGAALPGAEITALVRDRNGQFWVGGSEGIAYFPNPWGVFSEVSIIKPIFGTQFLLLGEYVTSIAVDGGNRKWIGTRNGLWLFNETGETLIHHFTTENSPLISNVILDVAVHDKDGEVFIATDHGLISYRGTATEGGPRHQAVKVFPNPVPSGFDGVVGIQGLAADATVKITSIAGALVRQLAAEGGTASWNMLDYGGQRVGTGIYLIFSATEDGEETFVGKIAVIN